MTEFNSKSRQAMKSSS